MTKPHSGIFSGSRVTLTGALRGDRRHNDEQTTRRELLEKSRSLSWPEVWRGHQRWGLEMGTL